MTKHPHFRHRRPTSIAAMEIGRELLKSARDYRSGVFSSRFWYDQLMNWAMKDPAFKLQLFRFIDVFPMLHTPRLVHDYLVDYLSQPGVTLPPGMGLGLKVGGLAKGTDGQDDRRADHRHGAETSSPASTPPPPCPR